MEWGCVGTCARSLAWKASSGGIAAIDPDEFEVAAKRGPDGETLLWLRYIPDVSKDEPADDAATIAITQAIKALTDLLAALKEHTA